MRLLGIAICLIVATVYYFVWPGWKDPEQVRQRSLRSRIILRWFHALAWVLLAAACFLQTAFPAVLAGVVYLMFLVTLARERRSARQP